MDAFALELDGKDPSLVVRPYETTSNGGASETAEMVRLPVGGPYAFKGMTQHAAIFKALELYGPQTTKELFNRLNSGGMTFKKPVYISAIAGRFKDVVERTQDNRLKLKKQVLAVTTPVLTNNDAV